MLIDETEEYRLKTDRYQGLRQNKLNRRQSCREISVYSLTMRKQVSLQMQYLWDLQYKQSRSKGFVFPGLRFKQKDKLRLPYLCQFGLGHLFQEGHFLLAVDEDCVFTMAGPVSDVLKCFSYLSVGLMLTFLGLHQSQLLLQFAENSRFYAILCYFHVSNSGNRLNFPFQRKKLPQIEPLEMAVPCASYYFLSLSMEGTQILLKLISVGDTRVGKSCIIKRYCEGRFVQKYITTIGVDYGVKKVNISGRKVAVNFFDLSGSPDYEEIRNPFFEGAQVVLLVFDLQNRQSFNGLAKWETTMKNMGVNLKEAVVVLVGNKNDGRAKQVEQAEAIAYAKKKGFQYFPCSASTGENVNEIFEKAFTRTVAQMEDRRKAFG